MLSTTHHIKNSENTLLNLQQDQKEGNLLIDLPKNHSAISQENYFSQLSFRKNSGCSERQNSTRGSSTNTDEKRNKLNSKSPLFDQVIETSGEESPALSKQQSLNQPTLYLNQEAAHLLEFPINTVDGLVASTTSNCDFSDETNNDFEVKFKTELCRNFQITGTCRFGSKCSFAHGDWELRNKTHINLHYKSKKCNQFFEQGYCLYGSRCQYLHIEDSYTHLSNAYIEKILVWMERNPKLDIGSIMRKTHSFTKRLNIFDKLEQHHLKSQSGHSLPC